MEINRIFNMLLYSAVGLNIDLFRSENMALENFIRSRVLINLAE